MCIQIVERYANCGCVYHVHAVDPCPQFGRHQPQEKTIRVGYACPKHTSRYPTASYHSSSGGGSGSGSGGSSHHSSSSHKHHAHHHGHGHKHHHDSGYHSGHSSKR